MYHQTTAQPAHSAVRVSDIYSQENTHHVIGSTSFYLFLLFLGTSTSLSLLAAVAAIIFKTFDIVLPCMPAYLASAAIDTAEGVEQERVDLSLFQLELEHWWRNLSSYHNRLH